MFANPFLTCNKCGKRVTDYALLNGKHVNSPCGCSAGFESVCPSWSPVDGCRCMEHLGEVPHPKKVPT